MINLRDFAQVLGKNGSSLMFALPIDRATANSALVESLGEIADELRALGVRVLLIRRVAADDSVDSNFAPILSELTHILAVELIEMPFDRGIVAACNQALDHARKAKTGIFLLQPGTQPTAGSLSEMCNAADTDPMIGFVGAPCNSGAITSVPLSIEHLVGNALEARRAYDHIHPHLPRVSYVATASGPCLYIKPSMLQEFGGLDESFATLAAAQDDFMMRCNLRGYRAVLANRAYAHTPPQASEEFAASDDGARDDYERLAQAHPTFHRAMGRTLGSAEFKAKRLLAGLAPNKQGRYRILFECSHLGPYFNGTFEVTAKLVARFVEQFSSRYECWISCRPKALQFHGLDQVNGLHYAGDSAQAAQSGPYLAAIRLAQPFSLQDLVRLGSLAPLSGFLMLDTIAMDCQNLDDHDLHTVWSHMARTVSMVGYISQFTAEEVNRRFTIPDTVAQASILLSTDPAEYVPDPREPKRSDHLLLVGNRYSHKHLLETIALFRKYSNRPPIVILGMKIDDEAGITSYPSGGLEESFVEQLYRDAIAVVFPTHYEGFGLPIMHALGYKKPVFARALPVFEEIRERAPGASNIHVFETTSEIVEAALADTAWHDDPSEKSEVQTWAGAARQLESLISQAESKLTYSALHDRLLAIYACAALIAAETAVAAAPNPQARLPLPTRVRRKMLESYVVRGARAWLSFKPGSRPHRTLRYLVHAVAGRVLRYPRLVSAAKRILSRSPKLSQRLRNAVRGRNAEEQNAPASGTARSGAMGTSTTPMGEFRHLSTEAQRIAADLRRLNARR